MPSWHFKAVSQWGYVKRFFLALRTKLNLDGDIFFVTVYQGYPRLRHAGFYLVCVHSVRVSARTECTQTKYYFLGQ